MPTDLNHLLATRMQHTMAITTMVALELCMTNVEWHSTKNGWLIVASFKFITLHPDARRFWTICNGYHSLTMAFILWILLFVDYVGGTRWYYCCCYLFAFYCDKKKILEEVATTNNAKTNNLYSPPPNATNNIKLFQYGAVYNSVSIYRCRSARSTEEDDGWSCLRNSNRLSFKT